MKKHSQHQDLRVREMPPGLNPTKAGVEVLCPFCQPPHPILPGEQYPCGTILKVTAVQTVLTAHGARQQKITCIKCHKTGGGDMVRFNDGFVHLEDCMPETKLLTTPPRFSRWARYLFSLPEWARKRIEKRTGKAQQVKEIDREGKETGRVLGYFFLKGGTHAKNTRAG